MRYATSQLLPVWRSWSQVVILYALMNWNREVTASAVAHHFGLQRAALNVEARNLERSGLVRRRSIGRAKVLELVSEHPAVEPLRTLVDLTIGPLIELGALHDVVGVERIAVFGSWARRHRGEVGPRPNDLDVLVIGDVDAAQLFEECARLSGRLGLPVQPYVVAPTMLATLDMDPLTEAILSGPLIEVERS